MGLAQEFRVDAQFRGFKKRGILIAVEGGDRGGKSTQCMRLKEWFTDKQGGSIEYLKFPGKFFKITTIMTQQRFTRAVNTDRENH